jgi:hypothetical protein
MTNERMTNGEWMNGDASFVIRYSSLVILSVAIVWLAGCGGGDRPKTIPISGRVTIDGQPPGEVGRLHFTPTQAAEGYSKRPAGGAFTADGTYRVMSWEPDDGLVPGHYTVSLMPGDLSKTAIPPKYRESGTSGLEVDVPADEDRIEYNINIVNK